MSYVKYRSHSAFTLVMDPISEGRGLCLASTATQKGDLSALVSSTDTSRHHDKVPVLTQNLPDEQRSHLGRCFTLAVRSSSDLVIRNPISSLGGHSASRLSLWDESRTPTMADHTTGCLSAPVVYHEQISLYSGNSSPWLKPGDSLPHWVESITM
jgi:hypothetical protein